MKKIYSLFCLSILFQFSFLTLTVAQRAGSLNTSFGNGGIVTNPIGIDGAGENAMAIQTDGKIVLAGQYLSPASQIALARFNTTGNLDSTFGTNGIIILPTSGSFSIAWALAIQPDGKIIEAGTGESAACTI